MAFINWRRVELPADTLTGERSPDRYEAVRNDVILATVVHIPGSKGIWKAGLNSISPIPALFNHDAFHPERGRFPNPEVAMELVEDYLNRWLMAMDMTWTNPVDFDIE